MPKTRNVFRNSLMRDGRICAGNLRSSLWRVVTPVKSIPSYRAFVMLLFSTTHWPYDDLVLAEFWDVHPR